MQKSPVTAENGRFCIGLFREFTSKGRAMVAVIPVSVDQDLKITPQTPPLNAKLQVVFTELLAALKAGQLEMPVLPDMAMKVKQLLENPKSSVDQFVKLLSTDPEITLYL